MKITYPKQNKIRIKNLSEIFYYVLQRNVTKIPVIFQESFHIMEVLFQGLLSCCVLLLGLSC